MGLRIPPRALQLVAIISDNPNNRRESIVYFYLTVMCAPITAQMLQQSKALRAWCNDAKLDIGRDDEAFTWSADGTFNGVASSKCVLWTHSSLEQVVMPKSNAPKAVRTLGRKLARTLRSCCDGMGEIELLFEIKGTLGKSSILRQSGTPKRSVPSNASSKHARANSCWGSWTIRSRAITTPRETRMCL